MYDEIHHKIIYFNTLLRAFNIPKTLYLHYNLTLGERWFEQQNLCSNITSIRCTLNTLLKLYSACTPDLHCPTIHFFSFSLFFYSIYQLLRDYISLSSYYIYCFLFVSLYNICSVTTICLFIVCMIYCLDFLRAGILDKLRLLFISIPVTPSYLKHLLKV